MTTIIVRMQPVRAWQIAETPSQDMSIVGFSFRQFESGDMDVNNRGDDIFPIASAAAMLYSQGKSMPVITQNDLRVLAVADASDQPGGDVLVTLSD